MKFAEFCDFTKKYPNETVQVFIDQSNLYKAIEKAYPGHRLDYKKLAMKLVAERKLLRINIYISTLNSEWDPEPSRAQQEFISALRHLPFVTVKTRPLRYKRITKYDNKTGTDIFLRMKRDREKGIDILLATDMLSQAYVSGYESMILVSGDGDYAPVLEEIKAMGKRVENAFLEESRSNALRSVSDIFIDLDKDVLGDCLKKKPVPLSGTGGV